MRPFEGIRVIDMTHVLAGPFCTFQLATLGADVIKVEPPGDPDMTRHEGVIPALNREQRGTYFMSQNAGKRALTLNLKQAEGRDILKKLVAEADVLVENYTGGSLEKLGLGYDDLSAINPKLIYCSMTGFGHTGPKRSHPAYDIVIQAFSGIMAANGTPETSPVRVGPPMVDYGTGAQAALAVSAALYQRDRTGKGQRIDVAMLDAALMLMSAFTTDTITTGKAPEAHGNKHPNYAGYATYETADGLIMVGAWTNKQLARLLTALGHTGRGEEVRQAPRADIGNARDSDAALIAGTMMQKSADEWEEILNEARVPAARVRKIEEALAHEQVKSRAVVQGYGDPVDHGGPASLPVAAYTYAHGSPSLNGPPPRVGEHNGEILQELGYSTGDLDRLRQQGII